jgi:uncharacterized peroxidase-related enzyme
MNEEGYGRDEQDSLVDALCTDPENAPVTAGDRALLRYVMKVNAAPAEVGAGDIAALREAGFDDRAIHDICAITAYFNFVNRIADGLGIELEPRFGGT